MAEYRSSRGPDGRWRIEVPFRGAELIAQPMYNKSSAFTAEERRTFGLEGLLPEAVSTMEQQADRVYRNIVRKEAPIERYIGLMALQDRNEHLFYRLLLEHLDEFLPIVYTPTVGQASKEFSRIFRNPRGLWITPGHKGRIAEVLRNSPFSNVRLSVVTDNQAILGIGDQGAGGIVIPVGKLSIYCAAAGVHPSQVLPLSLDVGTDNEELLNDPLYLGWPERRLTGEAYRELVDELVEAMREVFPGALLQWEDFSKSNAFELLERYRGRILSFNDDVQGTGAMTLAGLMAACRLSGESLADQRILIAGGGAAGIGIGRQLQAALAAEGLEGVALESAIGVTDSRGLLTKGRERVFPYQESMAWGGEALARYGLEGGADLASAAAAMDATVLIGTSGQPGLFSEEMVRSMAARVERPVVFPLSNPTSHAEAVPEDLVRWTEGRALMGTGSPFDPVEWDGMKLHVGQGNNAFIFPGVGLGALVAGAREVTDGMFTAAASALAESLTDEELERGQLYPEVSRLREVTRRVAVAVLEQARTEGVAPPAGSGRSPESDAGGVVRGGPSPDSDPERELADAMWTPEYPELVPV